MPSVGPVRPEDVPVVILCGGEGTRIREVTERIPKPLVDIGGQPILWHLMKLYGHHGFHRFLLCLGYKGSYIKDYFLRYREHRADFTIQLGDHEPRYLNEVGNEDWTVTCAETGLHSGTGARLRLVEPYIDGDHLMYTYGDGIGAVDVSALLRFHLEHGRIGTVTGVRPSSRYGEMRVEGDQVVEFNEKPTTAEGFVNGGFFVFRREIFDYLDDDPSLMLEQTPLQKVAREGQLAVFPHEGFWLGMDTYREWTQLNALWERGDAPWKVWAE